MITVLASIELFPENLNEFIEIFKKNISNVRSEEGSIEYYLTVDICTDIDIQMKSHNMVTVIEKWQNLDAFYAHLNAPHMQDFQGQIKDMMTCISIKVLQNAVD